MVTTARTRAKRAPPAAAFTAAALAAAALAAAALAATGSLAGCAHSSGPAPLGPGRALASEAGRIGSVAYEDDFLEARLIFQALAPGAPERGPLRAKLLRYLLNPLLALDAEKLKRDARELESDDVFEMVFESFRDALGLYDPIELWSQPPRISAEEQRLLRPAANLVIAAFSPRGADAQVVLALAALATMAPDVRETQDRLEQVLRWTEEAGSSGSERGGLRRGANAVDALENALGDWPAPVVVRRLDGLYAERQQRFSSVLRRPIGSDASRRALGDLLLAHGEEMQRAVTSMAGAYLRAGMIGEAATRTARMAGNAGDDPELRALLTAASKPDASAPDALALARRFLPRIELLGGTATDAPDPLVAFRVLEAGIVRHPSDPELLILSSRVSRLLSSYFLAIRRLEEAQAVLERTPTSPEIQGRISAELLELYFLRLRLRLDPERDTPAYGEADFLRRRFAETRQRFSGAEIKVQDADIDFELGRSYVNAGLIDRAEPLFVRARGVAEPRAEVSIELANLASKRGDPRRAIQILRDGLDGLRAQGSAHDTIGSVEGRARLERLLGDGYEAIGEREPAAAAWRSALIGWERLMVEYLRRKNLTESAEAAIEIGRLTYSLGRPTEALAKFDEAIEQDPDRDQSYIDLCAFLVQHGETEAALRIHHQALARPGRAVSEYVKVYTSLWVLDLSRRTTKVADPKAEAYLATLDQRHGDLRPHRGAPWAHLLARYAIGKVTYPQALAAADTAGKRAEIYFYEGMRRLADGKSDDAHQLWQKVIETRMFSFFEFDMASRYLRLGAPTSPAQRTSTTETI